MDKRVIAALAALALGAVGVILLINYANGANERAFDNARLEKVLQVTEPIAANTKATELEDKVKSIELPHSAIAKGAIKSLAEVSGLLTTTDLEPGEQLLASRFATEGAEKESKATSNVPEGSQEVTISVSAARAVAGTLKVGDTIGVIASYQTKEGDGVTQLIRNFVPITRITAAPPTDGQTADGGIQLITVAVRTRDAGKIINAIEFGKVWLTKQNPDTITGNGGSISRDDVTE